MIDIHSHILPMIDDGASSVEMALEMLRKAYDDGTDAIILTPHFAKVYGFNNPNKIAILILSSINLDLINPDSVIVVFVSIAI